MKVTELDKNELRELKERYYMSKQNMGVSIGELMRINEIVSDEEIYKEFEGIEFVKDDFFCNIEGLDDNII